MGEAMRRRSRAGGKPIKTRRRKAATLSRPNAPKVRGRRKTSSINVDTKNALLKRERDEARERETATANILGVIARSPDSTQPVFEAIVNSGLKLFPGTTICIAVPVADQVTAAAVAQPNPVRAESWRRIFPFPLTRDYMFGVAILDAKVVDVPNVTNAPPDLALGAENFLKSGYKAVTILPMMRGTSAIGALSVVRIKSGPLSAEQLALLKAFAAQAVIAIENTRLLNELRESLQQQTATADVLKVISSSPGELEPVFSAMLENAVRICEAKFGFMNRYDGHTWTIAAVHGAALAYTEYLQQRGYQRPGPETVVARIARTNQIVHIADLAASQGYAERDPVIVAAVELGGVRTLLGVPMLKEDELIGAILLYRQEVRPFTNKQIELVQNFAAQAVIAIENTRLLNELRQRTDDLAESLEQQTATSEVLRVISSSPGELEPVFQTMLANAVRLCHAKFGMLWLAEGDHFRSVAFHDVPPALAKARQRDPLVRFGPHSGVGRVLETKRVHHIDDITNDPGYIARDTRLVPLVELGGARTVVFAPLLKDNEVIGTLTLYRQEVRPFTDKQITLVQNFAAQAVIAIENTRLLNELRQSLEQQTATADVLKVISRSTFDLQTVLNTLVASAARLCEVDFTAIVRLQGSTYHHAASYGMPPGLHEQMLNVRFEPGEGTTVGRAALGGQAVQIVDAQTDPGYALAGPMKEAGVHTMLGVPLLREGNPIGVIILGRTTVRPFTDKQIELVQTFADQAVIAIENVRLFDEIQDKSRQLEVASQHKSQFLANMSHELRTPLNAILGYTELMADGIYGELPEKTMGVLKRLESNGRHLLGLINDVLDLSKIEAGQLVLELTDYSLEDIAQTVRSTLEPLAADKKLAFKVEVAAKMPAGHGDGRRLTQVVINLVGNAIKFTDAGEVVITAGANDGSFKVSVRDTGPGISTADQAKLFQEFQQADNAITRKKGGTGLGLAISKRIIEMHGGKIWVESQVGQGSTFSFMVPVRTAQQVQTA
jgi:signal transduction histidine kinase